MSERDRVDHQGPGLKAGITCSTGSKDLKRGGCRLS